MSINTKDVAAGALFILLGLGFGSYAYLALDLGTALRMGPGYFPLVLSGILVALGAGILVRSFHSSSDPWGVVPWRGLVLITIGPILFGFTVRSYGLVPALALVSFITALASHRLGIVYAIVLSAGLVLLCLAVFSWGLGVPLQLFGPAIRGLGLGL